MATHGEVKEQVVDRVPKRITELSFGILSNQDIVNQAVLEVSDRHVYDASSVGPQRAITKHGPIDPRMGISSKSANCETCGEDLKSCNGHFGHVKLALPAFHIGYLKMIIEVLHSICKDCSHILLDETGRQKYLKSLRRPELDSLQRTAVCKKIAGECKKVKKCPHCGAQNGPVRKVAGHPLKIVHYKYDAFNKSTAKKKEIPRGKPEFDKSFELAKNGNAELEKHIRKAVDDMNPLRVLNLFKRIPATDCPLLGMQKGRPEAFIWQYVPAPPVTIRPSVQQDGASNEDDITNKLGDIIQISSLIRAGLQKGQPVQTIMEQWDFLQLQIAMYVNSDLPGLVNAVGGGKRMRGFCQRLKGKQGRFRGNLSGKRVDFSGRTVIGPDPNLSIEEVAVPERVAKNMTYPEKVTRYNIEKLRNCVRRGKAKHPGANFIIKKDGRKLVLEILAKFDKLGRTADELEVGDVVERHIEDGDIVLFNRQPSLHKLSILSHKAKIRPWRTFRLNECVCNPYNADFDGDEMNLHVPQTEEARTEAIELMGVKNNLATPKNGTPIIAAIQDFITCAFLTTRKDLFLDRKTFTHLCGYMFNDEPIRDPETGEYYSVEIPPPAIVKPEALWTGKQLWNVLMRPNRKSRVLVNLDAACKQYKGNDKDMNINDAWLVIRNSEVMCGVMDKATVGDGKKDSVFYVIMRDYGPDYAVQAMNRLAKLSARWLTNRGFSIGVSDVTPGARLVEQKKKLIEGAYDKAKEIVRLYQTGKLERAPGCDEEMTMENEISGVLNKVRAAAGDICFSELSNWNSPLIMAKCGSKGSNINVAQMVAAVGQQIIGGQRVLDGFQDRTLPHFPKGARLPDAKGFVANSFYSGLTPFEFIFHAMSGREGLVDTAVKTAETGYMSRRLMKSLEDLSAQYDDTVRNSASQIVQFRYGDDNLDPVDMEGKAKPVNFVRSFDHARTTTWDNNEASLLPDEIRAQTKQRLDAKRKEVTRYSETGESMSYRTDNLEWVDQKESKRDFYDDVENFIKAKADRLEELLIRFTDVQASDARMGAATGDDAFQNIINGVGKISKRCLHAFIDLCLTKHAQSHVQPGHAVGAVGAQSIGEPGTQMTLKTFHFAGVAGMSITQGVPRIKEIINASKVISTPVITCELENKHDIRAARMVKARIEKTYLRDIIAYIEDVWYPGGSYISMRVDFDVIEKLGLDIGPNAIIKAIRTAKALKLGGTDTNVDMKGSHLRVTLPDVDSDSKKGPRKPTTRSRNAIAGTDKISKDDEYFSRVQSLKRALPDVVIKGYPDATRAIIKKEETATEEISLLVEGYGLKRCMSTDGVKGTSTRTNSVLECFEVLGIEAARTTIIAEIAAVMNQMDIDPRHMQLLADVMTYKGDILGITRFGLAKMRDSVLQLASFEKTPDHLFEAGFRGKGDSVQGVSECIILGQSMGIGTGGFKVVRKLNMESGDLGRKGDLFEGLFSAAKAA
ncbi:beta and beta-prime subunits of DNA dependent RNA-polymerase [Saccharata proteae CBS 121410]|uniref:DNA-directed RNA polymerase subunit n=1 Tax=Saccharata proteae CBS 121410 TaxID=1314787 RepID=A0A9P4HUL4_9PEZI|nr:beta and beta-prime subunits of DNA dependent RNA-polymerase [Saccharata proteae CBS 121410]